MIRHLISTAPVQKGRESGGLIEQDLKDPVWREQIWDQVHPRVGKYRPDFYPGCTPWLSRDEQFLLPKSQSLQQPETQNRWLLSQKWKYWISGTYEFTYPSKDEPLANVTLKCDWANADSSFYWSIELLLLDAAYPGIHRGFVFKDSWPRVIFAWETPFFSKYGQIKGKVNPKGRVLQSQADSQGMPVKLGGTEVNVIVLQYVLRTMCALLIYGPLYESVPKELEAPIRLENYTNPGWGDKSLVYAFFQKNTAGLRNATSFFSRAYNNPNPRNGERQITSAERQSTMDAVDCVFKHFGIIQEPPWVGQDDWVDQLPTDLEKAQTLDEWQKVECQWATLVSYSTGLKLHQGPWAGPLWERYCSLCNFPDAGEETCRQS